MERGRRPARLNAAAAIFLLSALNQAVQMLGGFAYFSENVFTLLSACFQQVLLPLTAAVLLLRASKTGWILSLTYNGWGLLSDVNRLFILMGTGAGVEFYGYSSLHLAASAAVLVFLSSDEVMRCCLRSTPKAREEERRDVPMEF